MFPATAAAAVKSPCDDDYWLCHADTPTAYIATDPPSPRANKDVELYAGGAGRGLSFAWDLDGDGAFDDGTADTLTYRFAAGTRNVGLQVTDQFGRTATERRTFLVDNVNRPPHIRFGLDDDVFATNKDFKAHLSTPDDGAVRKVEVDTDDDGAFDDQIWEWPNGDVFGYYFTGGPHPIGVRATDDEGASSIVAQTVNVRGPGQRLLLGVGDSGDDILVAGRPLDLFAYWAAPDSGHFEFDLDGDGAYETDQGDAVAGGVSQLEHVFTAGDHRIGARATDSGGHVYTASQQFTVEPSYSGQLTAIRFAHSGAAVAGEPVDLTVYAYPGQIDRTVAYDLDGDGEFDDGTAFENTSTAVSIKHTFTAPGTYEVRAKVTRGSNGMSRIASSTILVVPAAEALAPRLGRIFLPDMVRAGRPTTFSVDSDDEGTLSFDLDGDGQFDDVPDDDGEAFRWTFTGPVTMAVKSTGANGVSAISRASVQPLSGIGFQSDLFAYRDDEDNPFPRAGEPMLADYFVLGDEDDCCDVSWDADGDGDYDDGTDTFPAFTPGVGRHTVGVRVQNPEGTVTTTRDSFTLGRRPPVVTIALTNDYKTAKASAVDPDGDAVDKYEWDLDNDRAFDDATATGVAVKPGARVGLKATDAGGDIGISYIDVPFATCVCEPPPTPTATPTPTPTPTASPVPGPPTPAPVNKPLALKPRIPTPRLATLLSRGLTVTTGCETACRATVTIALDKATAKRLKLKTPEIGTAKGTTTVTVKLSSKTRKALRTLRSFKLKVAILAAGSDGRIGSAAKTITVRR
ncbi:PKD domain-containing protein [Solirubrobacter soli]|uniref:PKD domain-containing protein n=1 Tax=Solirubrobacter soli TaxID=363832 RepID=UPI0003FC3B95|nr:PKD domain-containing protein [Solirubrobacter soli]